MGIAEDLLRLRVGTGLDVHGFEEGGRLVLAGVDIPHTHGLEGHSDADLVAHAVTDALLGAAGMADIGTYFPSEDDAWKGAAQRTVDNARMRYFILHAHKLLDPATGLTHEH